MRVEIYTDGACSNNGKPNSVGGWAVIMRAMRKKTSNKRECVAEKVFTGNKAPTTNNEMELKAILVALQNLKPKSIKGHSYHIYTDSKYCIKCVTEWIEIWHNNGWRTVENTPVKNREIIENIYNLMQIYNPTFHWVKGHAKNALNNRADELAVKAKLELMEELELVGG